MGAAVPLQSRCTPFPSQHPPGIPMSTHRKTSGRGLHLQELGPWIPAVSPAVPKKLGKERVHT